MDSPGIRCSIKSVGNVQFYSGLQGVNVQFYSGLQGVNWITQEMLNLPGIDKKL